MLVQRELIRRGHEHHRNQPYCAIIHTDARPWSDPVERAHNEMSDRWDSHTALGGLW